MLHLSKPRIKQLTASGVVLAGRGDSDMKKQLLSWLTDEAEDVTETRWLPLWLLRLLLLEQLTMASMVDPRLVLSVASLLLDLLLPLPAADVECCKKGADHPVKVGGVDISPDSIARGKSATFTISANTVSGLYLLMITECNPNESSKEWSSRALNSSLGISR
ncbi:unnamed protein product [Musa acuminata var. zebrina]